MKTEGLMPSHPKNAADTESKNFQVLTDITTLTGITVMVQKVKDLEESEKILTYQLKIICSRNTMEQKTSK